MYCYYTFVFNGTFGRFNNLWLDGAIKQRATTMIIDGDDEESTCRAGTVRLVCARTSRHTAHGHIQFLCVTVR